MVERSEVSETPQGNEERMKVNVFYVVLAKTVAPKYSYALRKKFHSCACSFS